MFSRDCENDVWSAPSPAALEGKSPQTIERDRRLCLTVRAACVRESVMFLR